ncbi:unnamed protein product [Sympodiomycopsis kandeliae]
MILKRNASPSRRWLVSMISVWLLVVLLAVTAHAQQQHNNQDGYSIGHTQIHQSTTPQQAYTQALSLLRSVIDPTALSKHHQHIQRTTHYPNILTVDADDIMASDQSSHSPAPPQQQQTTNRGSSRMQRQQQRSRTTPADLSPSSNILTSKGPNRNCHTAHTPHDQRLALGPEWEFDLGHTSLYRPFLIPTQNKKPVSEASPRQSSSLSYSYRVIEYMSNAIKTALIHVSPSGSHHSAATAQGRRQHALSLWQYAADPPSPQSLSADALCVLSQHHILGTHAIQPQPWLAFPLLTRLVDTVVVANASAHHLLSWLHSSG